MRKFKKPIYACIDLTYNCNLSCEHCVFKNGSLSELNTQQVKDLLDRLEEEKYIAIQFSGGEPLLRKDFIELLDYASHKKFAVSLATNGTLIDENMVTYLKKYHLKSVQVSIDGLREYNDALRGAGTYDKILKAIDLLSAADLPVAVATMVTQENRHEMKQLLDVIANKKITYWRLQQIVNTKESTMERTLSIQEFLKTYEEVAEYVKEKNVKFSLNIPCYLSTVKPQTTCDEMLINITPEGKITKCFFSTLEEANFIPIETAIDEQTQLKGNYYVCQNAVN